MPSPYLPSERLEFCYMLAIAESGDYGRRGNACGSLEAGASSRETGLACATRIATPERGLEL